MIIEKMIEMLCLREYLTHMVDPNKVDVQAMSSRLQELVTEFVEPYVIEPAPKGE